MCLVLLFGLCARPLVASPLVSIDPVSSTVAAGSSFFLDIDVTNIDDLFSFSFDVLYDPTLLTFNSITEGSFLASGGSTFFGEGDLPRIAGSVTNVFDLLLGDIPGVSGTGTLARLSFTALVAGTSTVGLSNLMLLDSGVEQIFAGTNGATVTTVPEPASGLLLISGLAAAWRARRRLMPV